MFKLLEAVVIENLSVRLEYLRLDKQSHEYLQSEVILTLRSLYYSWSCFVEETSVFHSIFLDSSFQVNKKIHSSLNSLIFLEI